MAVWWAESIGVVPQGRQVCSPSWTGAVDAVHGPPWTRDIKLVLHYASGRNEGLRGGKILVVDREKDDIRPIFNLQPSEEGDGASTTLTWLGQARWHALRTKLAGTSDDGT